MCRRPRRNHGGHLTRIVERPKARQAIEDIAAGLGPDHPVAARRFVMAVKKAYKFLAADPKAGSNWQSEDPRLAGVRYFLMPWHPNFVIFHRPIAGGVEVIHILHGADHLNAIIRRQS